MSLLFFLAAIPEEFFKFVFLKRYIISEKCDEPYDMVFYGAMVSVGFAAVENVGYVMDHGLGVAVARAFTAVPLHAICGAIMGYGLLQSKMSYGRKSLGDKYFSWPVMKGALLLPVMIHGLYNWPLCVGIPSLFLICFWVGVCIYAVKRFRKIMNEVRQMT